MRTTIVTALSLILFGAALAPAMAERTGKTQQPLVAGEPVTLDQQRELGLVQVRSGGGSCSGILLNRYWVLTADHCVTTDGKVGGPSQTLSQIVVSAAWSKQTAEASRIERFAMTKGLDVALVLMIGDIGMGRTKLIYHNQVDTSMTLTVFGRGLCTFATGEGKDAKPAESNCGYRSAVFKPTSVSNDSIVIMPNDNGQIPNPGDSGGPVFVTDPASGTVLSVASVHSGGKPSGWVKGHENEKRWITGIEYSISDPLYDLRSDILNLIKEDAPFGDARTKPPSGDFTTGFPKTQGPIAPGGGGIYTAPDAMPKPRGPIGAGGGGIYTSPDAKPKPPAPPVGSNPNTPPATPGGTAPAPMQPHFSFSGDWDTVTAAGKRFGMKLIQRRRNVSGTYTHPDGRVAGIISGRVRNGMLIYQWQDEGGQEGSGQFELSDDGNAFAGTWGYGDDAGDVEGSWNGTRK
jgi:hypothetical protein